MKRFLYFLVLATSILNGYSQSDTISDNIYQLNGKLGIGTSSPNALLKISGDFADGDERALIRLQNRNNGVKSSVSISLNSHDETSGASFGWTNENFAAIPDFNNM